MGAARRRHPAGDPAVPIPSEGDGIGNLGNFAAAAAIQSTFPSLKDKAGYSWAFGLYAALNAAFFAFAFVCVPETKGKELEAAGESVRASRTEEIAPDAADASVQA